MTRALSDELLFCLEQRCLDVFSAFFPAVRGRSVAAISDYRVCPWPP